MMKTLLAIAAMLVLLTAASPVLAGQSTDATKAVCTVFGPNASDCYTPNSVQTSIANHTTTAVPDWCCLHIK